MITVAIIAILIAIAVPSFIRAREATRTRTIQHDLVKIDDATRIYIIEYNLGPTDSMPAIDSLVNLGFLRSNPVPPVAGVYEAATSFAELGTEDENAFPRFVPDSGASHPEWRHPALIALDAGS